MSAHKLIVGLVFFLIAGMAQATQADSRLHGLFAQLKATSNLEKAKQIESDIWKIWSEVEHQEVRRLMDHGYSAMQLEAYTLALHIYDRIVQLKPDFAEGWNKRSIAHYMLGDYDASIRDVRQVLKLEPRHFGAMFGLGILQSEQKNLEAAVKSFEAALRVNPHLKHARHKLATVKQQLLVSRI